MNIQTLQLFLDFMYNIRNNENDRIVLLDKIHERFNLLNPNNQISFEDILVLTYKLVDDGFVTKKPSKATERSIATGEIIREFERPLFYISFDGILFKESGGYIQQQEDIKLERERIKIENRRNKIINNYLVVGTIGAAIAALLLLLWDIYKYYNPNQ